MPGPVTPAAPSTALPPITWTQFVDENRLLTPAALNLLQQLWAGVFGTGGIIDQIAPSGSIAPFAGSTVPDGWLLCDGTAYPQATYPKLYAAIGTTWGAGGAGTFKVPDGRDRTFLGASGTHPLGTTGGALSRTILKANLPSYNLTVSDPGHTHTVTDPGHTHTITDPGHHHTGGSAPASTSTAGTDPGDSTAANTGDSTTGITINSATTGVTNQSSMTGITVATGGSGTAMDTTPSYFAGNWIIKT